MQQILTRTVLRATGCFATSQGPWAGDQNVDWSHRTERKKKFHRSDYVTGTIKNKELKWNNIATKYGQGDCTNTHILPCSACLWDWRQFFRLCGHQWSQTHQCNLEAQMKKMIRRNAGIQMLHLQIDPTDTLCSSQLHATLTFNSYTVVCNVPPSSSATPANTASELHYSHAILCVSDYHLPCFIMTVRKRTITLEHGLMRTWRFPRFSALLMLFRASARTFMRTMMPVDTRKH